MSPLNARGRLSGGLRTRVNGLLSGRYAGACRAVAGFTLLETLVAVSIFGAVAVTIYLSFSTGMEAQAKIETASENLNRAGFALDLIADDLQNPSTC